MQDVKDIRVVFHFSVHFSSLITTNPPQSQTFRFLGTTFPALILPAKSFLFQNAAISYAYDGHMVAMLVSFWEWIKLFAAVSSISRSTQVKSNIHVIMSTISTWWPWEHHGSELGTLFRWLDWENPVREHCVLQVQKFSKRDCRSVR
jgi:hypothetical protein